MITDLLVDNRKRQLNDSCVSKRPRELFLEFLQFLVYKNSGYMKNVKPPGLTPVATLANVFFCAVRHLDEIVLNKPLNEFPFHCFFMRDSNYLDETLKSMERIGGTFTHLENELQP